MDAFFRTLPGVFDAIEASDEVRRAFVFAAWRRVAGEQIVERTAPVEVDGKRLVIAVADNTWKRNLETLASQLVFKLNATLGRSAVDFIEFRIEPESVKPPAAATRKSDADLRVHLPVDLIDSASVIRDEALRTTVLNAAANCLSRKT